MTDYSELVGRLCRERNTLSREAVTAIENLTRKLAEAVAEKDRIGMLLLEKADTHAREIVRLEVEADTLRAQLTATKARLAEAVEAVNFLMEMSEPPDRNYSCHVAPPCGWCEEYAGIAEAREYAAAFLAKQEVGHG